MAMLISSDPEYQIVVAMAENLVPDVCALVMGFLEDIHVEIGERRWKERIYKINEEYRCAELVLNNYGYCYHVPKKYYFIFNWRSKGNDQFHFNVNRIMQLIYNKNLGYQSRVNGVAQLPPNYL
jgi:hypothetical protein